MSLLKIKEVAVQLRVNYDEVRRFMHTGELPFVKLPHRRSYLIRSEDVEAFIERYTSNSTETTVLEKPGTVPGTILKSKPLEVAPNKRCQKAPKIVANGDKYQWMERYTRKGTQV